MGRVRIRYSRIKSITTVSCFHGRRQQQSENRWDKLAGNCSTSPLAFPASKSTSGSLAILGFLELSRATEPSLGILPRSWRLSGMLTKSFPGYPRRWSLNSFTQDEDNSLMILSFLLVWLVCPAAACADDHNKKTASVTHKLVERSCFQIH